MTRALARFARLALPDLHLQASVPFGPTRLGPALAHRILSSSTPAAGFPRRHDDDGVEQDLRAEARQVSAGGRRGVLHDRLRGGKLPAYVPRFSVQEIPLTLAATSHCGRKEENSGIVTW